MWRRFQDRFLCCILLLLFHYGGKVWVLNWVLGSILLHLFKFESLASYRYVGGKLGIKVWVYHAVFHFFFLYHSHVFLFRRTSLRFVLAYFFVGVLYWNNIIITFFRVILVCFCDHIPILFKITNETIESNFFLVIWGRIFTGRRNVSNHFCSDIYRFCIQTSQLLHSWVVLYLWVLLLRGLKLANILRWQLLCRHLRCDKSTSSQ